MPHQRTVLIVLIAIASSLLAGWHLRNPSSGLSRAELGVRDLISKHGRSTPANPKLIFLAIDNGSVALEAKNDLHDLFGLQDATAPEAKALSLMSEQWPWPRSVYALVLDRLMAAGAKTVTFDLNFPTPGREDAAFRAALEKYGDRVVIGSNFTDAEVAASGSGLSTRPELSRPSPTLIPQDESLDSRVGYVNFWPDIDGVIRQANFQLSYAQFIGAQHIEGEPLFSSLAAQAVRKFGHPELVPDGVRSRTLRFTAPPGLGFRPRSIFEIFVPEYWKRNFHSGADFEGALVVIGAAGNWQHDEHPTPFGLMAGPEVQLNVINAMLHGEFLEPVTLKTSWVICLTAGLLTALAGVMCSSPDLRFGIFAALATAWISLQFWFFNKAGVVAPVAAPLFVLGVTAFVTWIYDFVRALAEQTRLGNALTERQRAQELLESANEELERRVAERTAELSQANDALTEQSAALSRANDTLTQQSAELSGANQTLTGLLNEKVVLLKEVHHRVKNNLQIISSLLNLQSGYITDPVALRSFNESRNRVRSMALIHEKLYQSNDLAKIDFQDYLKTLVTGLQTSFADRTSGVRMMVEADEIMLSVDSAVPCGLIVNELVTNCFKYAFTNGPGEIRVSMKRTPDARLELVVADDGVGFPKGLDIRNTESLGMQVVTTLTDQLDGSINLRNGRGTTFQITFPEATAVSS